MHSVSSHHPFMRTNTLTELPIHSSKRGWILKFESFSLEAVESLYFVKFSTPPLKHSWVMRSKYLVALPVLGSIDSKQRPRVHNDNGFRAALRASFPHYIWLATEEENWPDTRIYEDTLRDMRNGFNESVVSKYIRVIYMTLNKSNFTLGKALIQ